MSSTTYAALGHPGVGFFTMARAPRRTTGGVAFRLEKSGGYA